MTDERLLTREEVAELFTCSIPTLHRFEKQGKLHPVRLSGQLVRYKASDVAAFLEKASQ